jgi:thiol-disulfide isomerase/thioredoxin
MRRNAALASLLLMLAACQPAKPRSIEGTWRAVLTSPGGELPFTLRVEHGRAVIINGTERAPVSAVDVHDSAVTLRFDHYDSAINATLSSDGNTMTGAWTRTVPAGIRHLAFRATRGKQPRFLPITPLVLTPFGEMNGIWKAEFTDADGTSPARGEFSEDRQTGRVTGTFLTPTGDDRYLEGLFQNGVLRLSTFDGAHAFLFRARLSPDGNKLAGDYWSRDSYHATWTATRSNDAGATLPEGWKDVGLTNNEGRFQFRFPDLDGNPVALSEPRFQNKVVLVNIFGSWCPNCNDEAPLLAAWDRKYRDRGLEIVGLAYEFTGDAARDREMVRRFAKHYGITYPLLLAGVSDKKKASATLPDLTRVLAYPTSLFIGRDGKVKKIYSGFAGPGTGVHHIALRNEMESVIESMLAESKR